MIKITNMTLAFDHHTDEIKKAAAKKLGISEDRILSLSIKRQSLDARANRPLLRVYTVVVEVKNQDSLSGQIQKSGNLAIWEETQYESPLAPAKKTNLRPLIIGSGPAGLFAGLILAEAGLEPLIVERGKPARERTKDVSAFWRSGNLSLESNVQFGEGGAGTFSDGKLGTRVKDKHLRKDKILQEMVEAGAPQDILVDNKPHVGTANLVRVVENIRKKIENRGGEYRFESKVVDIIIEKGQVKGVILASGEEIMSSIVVLAIGHSARDTFVMLKDRGVELIPKPFSIGLRIEHPQELIDRNQYGKEAGHSSLGAAEYQLSYRTSFGRTVYSFCMCPGGTVIGASSELDTVVTNGMSQYARDGKNANSAIVVEVYPSDYEDDPLGGFGYQRKLEQDAFNLGGGNYFAPVQLLGDFIAGKPSNQLGLIKPTYKPGVRLTDLGQVLPDKFTDPIREALQVFNKRIKGFTNPDAVLTGVETRTSCPLRILRGKDGQSVSVRGLYPAGEGSGYAGGIMSSAIDGIKAAEKIILTWNG